ncbi:flagellin [Aureimonas sp. SK2]|uniref:flagellin N-terminal helical domain-containing protein n=1 Tax=Aureimonas sp. SK2 TaxID=3015992 RepID=UPI0024443D0E|nr:flagellin [Aureimonas sp. SK2]
MFGINSSVNSTILANLRQINSDIATTQTRIGTGKKVNSAADDAAVWAVVQSIRTDQSRQESLSSGISLAKARADAAVAALNTTSNLLTQMTKLADDAAGASPDYTAITNKFAALKVQIQSVLNGADVKGTSYVIDATAVSVQIGADAANKVDLAPANQQTATAMAALLAVTTVSSSGGSATDMTSSELRTAITNATTQVSSYQATLSTFASSLGAQQDFLTALSDIRASAVSSLVDADMTKESAKIAALQTQQQLAYQALSISNSSAQNILMLFR